MNNTSSFSPAYLADLAAVVNADLPESKRLEALERVADAQQDCHWLKEAPLWRVLENLKEPWETRLYMKPGAGRAVNLPVTRPPECLADIL